jgi:hypothetical protein
MSPRSALLPLAMVWLALHAGLLVLLLGVKFVGAKLVLIGLLLLGTLWFLARQPLRLIPVRRRMV